jgi:O-antigen/teichoic acid export membrane protein
MRTGQARHAAAAPPGRGLRSPGRGPRPTVPGLSRLLPVLREPLHRTGNALVVNSGLTALIGVAFWATAARSYDRDEVGVNSTAITAMMMIAGFAQLNLMSAMVRFLPTSGRGAWRLVRSAYLLSAATAVAFGTVFLLGIHVWAPHLAGLLLSWPMAGWFVASTALWCVFTLQDSVLTGLGRPEWVPAENAVHSVGKLVLVVALATAWPRQGLFLSWTLAVVVAALPVNVYLFLVVIPRHVRQAPPGDAPPPTRQLVRFVAGDYAGAACWVAAITLPVQLVLNEEGAAHAASFSIAWIVAFTMYQVPTAVGQGLVVQGARDPGQLQRYRRKAFKHTYVLLVPAVLVLVTAAPWILRVFGQRYAAEGTTDLRLLALAALPYAVLSLTISELRVCRRVAAVFCVLFAACALLLLLSYLLLEAMGITGVGVGWLVGQTIMAVAILAGRRRLMGTPAADEAVAVPAVLVPTAPLP